MTNKEFADKIKFLVSEHHKWREECINILAAENVSSPTVRGLVASDLMHRYSEYEGHDVNKRWDEGGRYIIEIERLAQMMIRQLFQSEFVELRPISGHVAIMACICAFTKPGGVNLEVKGSNGGHNWFYFAKNNAVNYTPDWLPFDIEEWNIDIDAAKKKIVETAPGVITLGSSFYLFPHPTSELKTAADEVRAKVVYDSAHVFGLIAGRQWPNPLQLGADAVTGSTHKTFPGPQKGVVLTNDRETWLKIADTLYPGFLTNHHLMNVAAFAYAVAEFLEFGEAFATQVVKNAKSLGEALSNEGFDVIGANKGFTQSHQILVRTGDFMTGNGAAKSLDRANVICNKMELENANGLRLGTSEVTRIGMKESEMREVARFLRQVVIERKDPDLVAKEVVEFTKSFRNIHYSFDKGMDPYEYFEFKPRARP